MKDLTGEVINNRLITSRSKEKSGGHWKWNYKCIGDCGRIGAIREEEWRKTTCFCDRKAKPVIDMTGDKRGKWIVTDQYKIWSDSHAYWFCYCSACGNYDWVSRPNLVSGGSTNCGCVNTIDWNGMRFHSRWEIYVAMEMDELGIKYEREVDKIPVIHPDFPEKILYYMPDFTIFDEQGNFSHWIEVKGAGPKIMHGEWKTIQIAEKFNKTIIIREKELDKILDCRYMNIDRIYSLTSPIHGFDKVQEKIASIMSDPDHSEKVRAMLSII